MQADKSVEFQKFYFKSSVAEFEIVCSQGALISLKPCEGCKETSETPDFIKEIKKQLDEYFSGRRKKFDIKINPSGTEFQKKVWSELIKIPYGETRSYSEIAEKIDNKNAQRAVGYACNKNPIMIIIPCHRVISKNGDISGFAYGTALKKRLIEAEKVNFV